MYAVLKKNMRLCLAIAVTLFCLCLMVLQVTSTDQSPAENQYTAVNNNFDIYFKNKTLLHETKHDTGSPDTQKIERQWQVKNSKYSYITTEDIYYLKGGKRELIHQRVFASTHLIITLNKRQ